MRKKTTGLATRIPGEFRMESRAFRRLRLPWLLLAWVPAFIWDALVLLAMIQDTQAGRQSLGMAISIVTVNFLLWKALAWYVFDLLKRARERGNVLVREDAVVVRVFPLSFRTSAVDDSITYPTAFIFSIQAVQAVEMLSNGTMLVRGTIRRMRMHVDDDGNERAADAGVHIDHLRIPAYYEDMPAIRCALERLVSSL